MLSPLSVDHRTNGSISVWGKIVSTIPKIVQIHVTQTDAQGFQK